MKTIYRNENSVIFKNDFFDFDAGVLISPVETQNYLVFQVADSFYSSRFCIQSHTQQCDVEITFPITNFVMCATDNNFQKVNKNEMYISYKDDIHALKSSRGCRFQTLAINIKNTKDFEVLKIIKEKFKENRICNLSEVGVIFSEIITEFVQTDLNFSTEYLDSLITMILIKIARFGEVLPKTDITSTQDLIPAIINYIDSHFLDILSLEELSTQFGYNYGHICKTFHKSYGITPKEYLINKKMDYAISLLSNGYSVKDISEKLNYSTPYNFSRAFKKVYKTSPSNYINFK